MSERSLYFTRYRILIDGSYANDKRSFPLSPTQIHDYDFQVEKLFLEILQRETGKIIAEGIFLSGKSVLVQPYSNSSGAHCFPETWGDDSHPINGFGAWVLFSTDASCNLDLGTKAYKPGGAPVESLFHELVHAFRIVTGKASNRAGPSLPYMPDALKTYPTYDEEEEFFAVLITNIFSSETGRPLRKDHDDVKLLPPQLSTNKGFLAIEPYARLVRQFCIQHPAVSGRLYNVPSAFNPIKEVVPGVKADVQDLYERIQSGELGRRLSPAKN
jgi:hypothetical protein